MANRQPIAPILPVAPVAGSLLQSVSAVPGDWSTGVAFESRSWVQLTWPDCVSDWETCAEETLLDKPVGSGESYPECDAVAFDPFTIYTPITEISTQPDLARRLQSEVEAVHDALLSATIAKVLVGLPTMNGGAGLPFCVDSGLNPTLDGVDTTIAGGPRAPLTALAMLLDAYADEMGTTGGAVVHVAPVVLPFLVAHGIVARTGNRFIGPFGEVIVADAGYAGIGTNLLSTAYISGPVEVSHGSRQVIAGSELSDARLNEWALLVEERAIFRFEPRSVFSIGVTTPIPGSGEV